MLPPKNRSAGSLSRNFSTMMEGCPFNDLCRGVRMTWKVDHGIDLRENTLFTIIANVFGLIFVSCFAVSCRSDHSQAATRLSLREIAPPAPAGAFSPRVTAMRDGSLLLTWLESINDKLATLRASFWRDGAWSAPLTVVEARPFSRHPSESPGILGLSNANLIAYWSQKPTSGNPAQEVDVYFSVSTD